MQHRLCEGAYEPRAQPAGSCPRHSSPGWRGGAGAAWNTFHAPLAGWRWRRSTPAEHTLRRALANRFTMDGRPRVGRGKVPAKRCELQRKKRTSDVQLQNFRHGSCTFKVRSFEMRNFGFSPDKNLHHSTWSHEQSRAEVECGSLWQTFVQELSQLKVVSKTSSGGP